MAKKVGHYVTRPGCQPGDPPVTIPVAEELETVPGVPTRDGDVSFFSREYPLENVTLEESAAVEWHLEVRKTYSPEASQLYEKEDNTFEPIVQWLKNTPNLEPTGSPTGEDVTEMIQQKARELGYGEVGFTRYDHRYVYQSRKRDVRMEFPHAICLALEQPYEPTQSIPSLEGDAVHGGTYEAQWPLSIALVDYIRSLGYHAQVSGPVWHLQAMIPMFVAAGLGQLGANGQLLSPHFGSRARLQIILTDAKVTYDQPVDYGIHAFCQICQVCVNRCPGRALMREKVWFRGVEKNKLTQRRCRPVMARYLGCGVCMKVCPVQRYGMNNVMDHYVATGEVLGKGTHSLEGYSLKDKGYLGPGELPHFDAEFFKFPKGRTEDWLLIEFRDKLIEIRDDETVDRDEIWQEFRQKVEANLAQKTTPVYMGMDVAL